MRGFAIATAVLVGMQARAGTITTTATFLYAPHGSLGSTDFDPFNPTLGPLNAVQTTIFVAGSGPSFLLTNPTSSTITFAAYTDFFLYSVGGSFDTKSAVILTLGPGQSTDVGALLSSGFSETTALFSGFDAFLGATPASLPGIEGGDDSVFPSNPSITSTFDQNVFYRFSGGVTVTYYYGSTLLLPEPASLLTLSLGLAAVAGLAWHHLRAS